MLLIGLLSYGFVLAPASRTRPASATPPSRRSSSDGQYTLLLFAALLLGKLLATTISLGAGASGGVFSPSLFIGAALGGAVGTLGPLIDPTAGFSVPEFAVVGMGAMVGGATGASMTAIVMIFEMTRDYNVIVPLVLAVALAVGIRRWLITENIYTIKLRNRGRPIPTIRHTNMYLVQQARDLMSPHFVVLPAETQVEAALKVVARAARRAHRRRRRRAHRRLRALRLGSLQAGATASRRCATSSPPISSSRRRRAS